LAIVVLLLSSKPGQAAATVGGNGAFPMPRPAEAALLSPYWPDAIHDWSSLIGPVAYEYGLDPDFVAAVVKAESNGVNSAVSHVGAVGLMGIMPSGPGMEWRPSTEELANPGLNLDWGVAILTEILNDAGGDLYAALAAYSAGWEHVNRQVPQRYAADVLDDYGRAIAARSGVSPSIATRWTIAVEIRRGHVPQGSEPLILGQQPVSGLHLYGEHVIYQATGEFDPGLFIKGYAVPVALAVPESEIAGGFGHSDELEPQLAQRLTALEVKAPRSSPRVLLACLPSLSRLRGRTATRWFAPSLCPTWHR
jgi:hypothetical protein